MSTGRAARPRRQRIRQVFLPVTLVLSGLLSCRSKPQPVSGAPAGSGAKPQPGKPAGPSSDCRKLETGPALVLGSRGVSADPSEDADDLELPFSAELGEARAGEPGFAVPAIDHREGASFAVLALIDPRGARTIELGRVFGGVEPPAVAELGSKWLIALPTRDAGGFALVLKSLESPYGASNLKQGAEVGPLRSDAPAFTLSAVSGSAVLVFSVLDNGKGRLAVAEIDPKGPSLLGKPRLLPLDPSRDAEAPRLLSHPSGHLLAYLVRTPVGFGLPLPPEDNQMAASEELVDAGSGAIEVLPLDQHGAPVSSAVRITPPTSHVLAFDVAPLPEGGALVTYRDARRPGLDGSGIEAVRVRLDGSFEGRTWDVGESPGLPTIVLDPVAKASEVRGWVAFSEEGGTRLSPLGSDPLDLREPREERALRAWEPLAVHRGRILAAHSKGTQRELALFECKTGANRR